jgi:hypothetical protein
VTTPRPVFLHIGAMKTGTTYLQSLMFANRDALGDEGVLLPGASWGRQVRAVQDVLRLNRTDAHIRRRSRGAWDALLDEVHAPGHRASVVSMEFLSAAGGRGVRRVVSSFGDDDVHVVLTVRDMVRVLPAMWQTLVHNGATFSWGELLEAALAWSPGSGPLADVTTLPLRGPRDQLRRTVDVPRILHRWAVVPPGHLHVVTVPRSSGDPTALWRRLAEVVGVDPAVAVREPENENASIGYASTELVRRVNRMMPRISRSEYNWTVKEHLALDVLAERSRVEERAILTVAAYDRALEWNARVRDAVREVGAHVVGDLDDLPVEPDADLRGSLPVEPLPASTEQVLQAAEVALSGLEALRERRARRLARLGVRPGGSPHPAVEGGRGRWEAETEPVQAAAAEVAARCHELALMLREVRRLKAAHR